MLRSCCAAVILSSLNCRIRARPAPRALSSPQPLFRSARVHAPQEDPLMLGTEHPPSTTRSPRLARRALTTACAAVGAIALPIGLVAATAGSTETTAPTSGETTTSFLHTELVRSLAEAEPVPFADPAVAEAATTTTAPSTTPAPPPAPPPTVAPTTPTPTPTPPPPPR